MLTGSNLHTLCKHQRIFDINAQIANRCLDLDVSEQDLNCTQIAEMPGWIASAEKSQVIKRPAPPFEPRGQARARRFQNLELSGFACLLLDDGGNCAFSRPLRNSCAADTQ